MASEVATVAAVAAASPPPLVDAVEDAIGASVAGIDAAAILSATPTAAPREETITVLTPVFLSEPSPAASIFGVDVSRDEPASVVDDEGTEAVGSTVADDAAATSGEPVGTAGEMGQGPETTDVTNATGSEQMDLFAGLVTSSAITAAPAAPGRGAGGGGADPFVQLGSAGTAVGDEAGEVLRLKVGGSSQGDADPFTSLARVGGAGGEFPVGEENTSGSK